MSAAREVSALGEDADMVALCKAISSGSLRGARGNSGVILSQLFRGFTKSIKEEQVLDIPVLTRAFDKAVGDRIQGCYEAEGRYDPYGSKRCFR